MPELPEVESVRRLMARVLGGKRIARAVVAPDEIVLKGHDPAIVEQAVVGRRVEDVGRHGKFWWIALDERPWVFGHLGMSGWIRELGKDGVRLHSHGDAPFDDAEGNPRFLKLLLEAEDGSRVAFTDGRRLGRLWLAEGPHVDPQIAKLGPDVFHSPRAAEELHTILSRRKAPLKALLLDQGLFAGVGNWIADEVLYQARLSPKRLGSSLTRPETEGLVRAMDKILRHAVESDADYTRFPDDWLFAHRWGGGRGETHIDGREIVRETVGGRTTAWVPTLQK